MKEDIFIVYPILKFITGVIATLIGVFICLKYKFYRYSTDDMLFATKLKVFMSGLLSILIGVCCFLSYFFNIF